MPANIDTMIYVGETPWHGLGINMTDNPPTTVTEIIENAKLDWRVDTAQMYTELHPSVKNYRAIYRTDNNDILGVVNRAFPIPVQNIDMFNSVDSLLNQEIDVETAASLGIGETVFGCFKIRREFDLLDDAVDHYYVIVNDHTKCDGKITVLNTPIRVVCQNTLSAALATNTRKMRIPISNDPNLNRQLADEILSGAINSMDALEKKSKKWVSEKIDESYVNTVLDHLFPFKYVDGKVAMDSSNEKVQYIRDTFLNQCMGADNLNNYRGTKWQVFNAVTDFSQHYFKKVDTAYDLKHRMASIPGVVSTAETPLDYKFMKIVDKIAA